MITHIRLDATETQLRQRFSIKNGVYGSPYTVEACMRVHCPLNSSLVGVQLTLFEEPCLHLAT